MIISGMLSAAGIEPIPITATMQYLTAIQAYQRYGLSETLPNRLGTWFGTFPVPNGSALTLLAQAFFCFHSVGGFRGDVTILEIKPIDDSFKNFVAWFTIMAPSDAFQAGRQGDVGAGAAAGGCASA